MCQYPFSSTTKTVQGDHHVKYEGSYLSIKTLVRPTRSITIPQNGISPTIRRRIYEAYWVSRRQWNRSRKTSSLRVILFVSRLITEKCVSWSDLKHNIWYMIGATRTRVGTGHVIGTRDGWSDCSTWNTDVTSRHSLNLKNRESRWISSNCEMTLMLIKWNYRIRYTYLLKNDIIHLIKTGWIKIRAHCASGTTGV